MQAPIPVSAAARTCARSRRHPNASAVAYCAIVLVLGVQVGIFGPALLALCEQVRGNASSCVLSQVAYAASVRTVASMAASMCGWAYDRVDGHLLFGAAVILGGLGTGLIAVSSSVTHLYLCMAALGIASGFVDNGANVLMLWRFHGQARAQPWMQTLHFCFASGATLAPLLLRAGASGATGAAQGATVAAFATTGGIAVALGCLLFMLPTPPHPDRKPPAMTRASGRIKGLPDTGDCETGIELPDSQTPGSDSRVASPLPSGKETHFFRIDAVHRSQNDEEEGQSTDTPRKPAPDEADTVQMLHNGSLPRSTSESLRGWCLVVNGAVIFLLYVGAEHAYGTFITAYAVSRLQQPESVGQYMTSLYWGSIMFGRFLSIPASMRFTPAQMLTTAMICSALASIAFLTAGHNSTAFWVLTVFYGVSMAPQFPTTLALAETFVSLRGKHTTVFSIANGAGAWLLPFIVASCLGSSAPRSDNAANPTADGPDGTAPALPGLEAMIYVVCAACVLNSGVYAAFWFNGKNYKSKRGDQPR